MKNSKKAPKINPAKVINPYARALLCVTNPNIDPPIITIGQSIHETKTNGLSPC